MAFKHLGKYLAYETIKSDTIGYANDIETIYKKCQELSEKFNVPLKEFDLSSDNDYGSTYWYIQFTRSATPEEIEFVDSEEKRIKNWKRQQYEDLKKEFGDK